MLTKTQLEILRRAALGQLPRSIDQQTSGVSLHDFQQLYRAGLISAIDASADCGDSYLDPTITTEGQNLLRQESETDPWWTRFDLRVSIVSLVVAVLGLAAALGVLKPG